MSLYQFKIESMDTIAALCAPYVSRMTILGRGAQDPRDRQVWADVRVEESFGQNARSQVTMDVTLSVAVTQREGAGKFDMFVIDVLREVLRAANLPIFARIENEQESVGQSELQAATSYRRHTWSVIVADTVRSGVFLGAIMDSAASTIRSDASVIGAANNFAALPVISWEQGAVQYTAAQQEIFWAGLSGGETIDVLDAADAVVESIPVPTFPTGRATTATTLGTGTYRLSLAGQLSPTALVVQEPPA